MLWSRPYECHYSLKVVFLFWLNVQYIKQQENTIINMRTAISLTNLETDFSDFPNYAFVHIFHRYVISDCKAIFC